MAEQPDRDDKTEEPSAKRLQKARDEGRTAHSRDWLSFAALLAGFTTLFVASGPLTDALMMLIRRHLRFDVDDQAQGLALTNLHGPLAVFVQWTLTLTVPIMVAVVIAQALLGGLRFSVQALAPKFERLNPANGLKRLFGSVAFYELVKSVLKTVVMLAVCGALFLAYAPGVGGLAGNDIAGAKNLAFTRTVDFLTPLLLVCAVIGVFDAGYQWLKHRRDLRMTRQELRDEMKQNEGSPELRARIRRAQQETARNRSAGSVRNASLVLTNPTHFLVALEYEPGQEEPPTICAKARGPQALAMAAEAQAADLPVHRQPALTRAIYFTGEVGQGIREELFQAVAVVLAHVLNDAEGEPPDTAPPPEFMFDEMGRNDMQHGRSQ